MVLTVLRALRPTLRRTLVMRFGLSTVMSEVTGTLMQIIVFQISNPAQQEVIGTRGVVIVRFPMSPQVAMKEVIGIQVYVNANTTKFVAR